MNIFIEQQRQRGFETREAKSREKINADQHAQLRMTQRVFPLFHARASLRPLGSRVAAFFQNGATKQEISGAQSTGDPARTGQSKLSGEGADRGAENKTEPEGH